MLVLKFRRIFAFFVFSILYTVNIEGQNVLLTAAADVNLGNAQISYSVGQLFYESHIGAEVSFLESIHQPIISIPTHKEEDFLASEIDILLYPNPVDKVLILNVKSDRIEDFCYRIYNTNGHLLGNELLTSPKTMIDMQHLASSLYLVRVMNKNTLVKDFKILKR